ncbi:MAG: hypothetical protein SWH68_08845 [Thermodesulfobacteriota bacterium]|nr:hypothetical protein [Thermodesulfobacteriota bacterium]
MLAIRHEWGRIIPGGLFLIMVLVLVNGCAVIMPRPEQRLPAKALKAFTRLRDFNQDLSACKGLGKIRIRRQNRVQAVQLLWLCKFPDKMRLEALAPTGRSMLSLSLDGQHAYILPHSKGGKLEKRRMESVNLKHLIGIPVKSDDIMHFLAGRIPIRDFHDAAITAGPEGQPMLRLNGLFGGTVQTIAFDEELHHPLRVTYYSGFWHKTAHTVTFEDFQITGGFDIPRTIGFTAGQLAATFTIRRYWADPEIPDDRFILTDPRVPPESKGSS